MSNTQTPPAGTRAVTKKSALPIYAIGLVWLGWALLFPLHKLSHYLICLGLSLAVFFLLTKLFPEKITYEEIPQTPTGDSQADALLEEGRQRLAQIRQTAAAIQQESVRDKITSLTDTCQRIFDYVRQNPKSAAGLRKFLNYYLPTLQKLTDTYALLERQGVEGENITASKNRIDQMLTTMDAAFLKQLDALFGDTALDIDTDITVMEGMLAQEGLTGNTGDDGQIELKL